MRNNTVSNGFSRSTIFTAALLTGLISSTALVGCDDANDDDNTAQGGSGGTNATGGANAAGGNAGSKALVDIVDTAVAAGSFKTLAAALTAADLVTTLKGPGPFTVFAPTDSAFNKLPPGTVDELVKPENKAKLTAILTYHVVAGKVASPEVVKLTTAKTVQGSNVAIAVNGSTVKVNDATVTAVDVMASNGVIHVIDTVLMPPAQ